MTLRELMQDQAGVVSRRQVLACGYDDNFIETRIRRKDWARVHTGVYVDHTGPLSWLQRLWSALLFYGRAAACAESALVIEGVREAGPAEPLHVAVAGHRHPRALPGVQLYRLGDFEESLHPIRMPPRFRVEPAVLQVASRARDDVRAVAALADACQSRRTTPDRLAVQLRRQHRLPRRALLAQLLDDVAEGTFSVMEHKHLVWVERRHGLPRARRQRHVRSAGRAAYRDAEYLGGRLVVELDGRLGHDLAEDRWADLERDLHAAIVGAVTVRLGWRQVLDPCRTAAALVRLLRALGWTGTPRSCGPTCQVGALARAA